MKLELTKEEKAEAVGSIRRYFSEDLELEISELQAGFLLEYFAREFGPFAYNQGVEDAKQFLLMKSEDLGGTCFEEGLRYWKGSGDGSGGVRRKPGG